MTKFQLICLAAGLWLFSPGTASSAEGDSACRVRVLWKTAPASGAITADHGLVVGLTPQQGKARVKGNDFRFTSPGEAQLSFSVQQASVKPGPSPTVVHVVAPQGSFSFFLRDVNSAHPIYVPAYGAAVLPASDTRSYAQIEASVAAAGTATKRQRIEQAPETSFDQVAPSTRHMNVPIWLGLTRDVRMFELNEEAQENHQEDKVIKPIFSSTPSKLPESKNEDVFYRYALGRGVGALNNITRKLEQGTLPIYHSRLKDDDVLYHTVGFVALEKSDLSRQTVKGTEFVVADKLSGRVFPADLKSMAEAKLAAWTEPEQTVFYCRTEIENTGKVPRYAWMKAPRPGGNKWAPYTYDPATGFLAYSPDRVYCVSRYEGAPLPNQELAVLLQPGEKVSFDFYLPHEPISAERAGQLSQVSFEKRYAQAVAYWEDKLAAAARIRVPEPRINEMIQAGLLHLDMITFGSEPGGTLNPNVGVYGPIGTESAPVIQYYTSVGLNDIARRSLGYFLETQKESGQIENFNGYTVETGAALWTVGEYYRYTLDSAWIREISPKLLKACDYLMAWRDRNKKEELRGRGYGMLEGKVADPVDPYHQFVLNGYSYMGLSRMAEVLGALGYPQAGVFAREAAAWREDIRSSFFSRMALSPVVPLGDGTWCPTAPPWTEADGPRLLYQKPDVYRSHGTFTGPDAMLGPLYLVFTEVIDPTEPAARLMLDYHGELLFQGNTVFSQPYYSRHNWYQIYTGMVKPFLNTYYTTLSAHADRETYSFWEHFYRLSPHKTHEEANFLMETRWMLYMEQGDTLHLLRVIPRDWMADGKSIEATGVQSYFGKLSFKADSHVKQGYIEAVIECDAQRKPASLTIRLPHPDGKRPVKVSGGTYDPQTETVSVSSVGVSTRVRLEY